MSTYSKPGNDGKSNTLGSMNRQNVIQETNKRRTLLTDNSWIKNRPEEEEEKIRDENFGKSVLSRYKSQDNLDSGTEKDEKKQPIHNRFKSDDALDRIPSRNTFEGGNKAATLERVPMSGTEATNKRQSWAPSNKTTTTTTTTEESKRKSWAPTNRNSTTTTTTTRTTESRQVVPGKPEGQKITIFSSDTRTTDIQPKSSFIDSARSRFEKNEEKLSPTPSPRIQNVDEKPRLPPKSPTAKTDDRPAYPSKPVNPEAGERRSALERKQRSQNIDNLIEVSTSKVSSNKSTQDIDNLIDIKPTTEKAKKSTQDIDNLIDIKPTTEKAKKREQLDDFIEISNTAKNFQNKDDRLDSFIDIKKPDVKTGTKNIDNLIDIKTPTVNKGSLDLDDLIAISRDGNKGTATPASNSTNISNRSSTTTTTTYNVKEEFSNAPTRRSTTTTRVTDDQDMPSRRSTSSSTYKVTDENYDIPTRRSTSSYKDTTDGPNTSSNVTITSYSSRPNSSYGDESRNSSSNTYGNNLLSNSIKTVYSTSDRSVIQKDFCTYCRKSLGIEAKMILKELNICCHATCFKCEACSGSLENLKAGDSMWILKQTIHCEPCYFAAREKWII
ncbi:sciellin isoform X3 [Bufo gargarizans]|uniref:sciellin isoform X3 n=1 Tax=Bufo gargarizans TaxID=30331 RepID=UPI001CF1C16E|nr:sciellin isoform X3 [Bufo gargarizans]